jgi:hypothetical protein
MSYNPNQSAPPEDAVNIDFDSAEFPGSNGKFKGAKRKIKSLTVKNDSTGETTTIPLPNNGKCTITIITGKNPPK